MTERLLAGFVLWIITIGVLALRQRYAPHNLALVAAGTALFVAVLAISVDPTFDAPPLISLAAISGGLVVRGVDAEVRRRHSSEVT